MPVRRKPAWRIPLARRRGRDLLGVLVALRDCGTPIATLCARAAAAVDEYSQILIANLSEDRVGGSQADAERLRREYARMLADFALAVRDLIADPEARHALAQAIQCALLQHEHRLREVTSHGAQG